MAPAVGAETGPSVTAAARDLVALLEREPAGQVSNSVYETGRLVADAPWLDGHGRRLAYLLAQQSADGSWGPAGGYALVPTASAVQGLLAELVRADPAGTAARAELAAATARGLAALARRLADGTSMPDTPAADLIVPALAARIDAHLTELGGEFGPALPPVDRRRVDAVAALLATDHPVPSKLWHAYEVLGAAAATRTEVTPVEGAVGASPAATAAWLAHRRTPDRAARAYLDAVVARHGGPVPCCTPITTFERSWSLATLVRVGLPVTPSPGLVSELVAALGPDGAATGPGLPTDADTTSATLYALARLGHPVDPASLLRFDLGTHFCTWQGEDGHSITTNAHVLEALGWHARNARDGAERYAPRVTRLAGWLRDAQQPDGQWADRWHASPYYATCCAALALAGYAPAEVADAAVDRAADWVLATQRDDGGWGRWSTTTEETAYAVHVLLGAGRPIRPRVREAVLRALEPLCAEPTEHPPLWHDKDLYTPILIVRAAVIAARRLAFAATETARGGASVPRQQGADQGMITTA
ncbi:prenyltransferase/squalene oxidase repeat-containing protein [Micromonospora endophytica]|uniref:prenyltransferase/squalene oxidase repeat-containing protein n=1 Tax=Micromonospora endophytica TaxID=515350 RepID=UPI0021ABE175|nr:prenyltransferase/squalene oxidase repeat-containing protein [Micromonospora endophytica]